MRPIGKCIAKKCEDCNFFYTWDMENKDGIRKQLRKCVFLVLSEEIPRIRGSIDGVQGAANEARNRSMETKQRVEDFGTAIALSFDSVNRKLIGDK